MASSSSRGMKENVVESTRKPNWLELPSHVTANILNRLDVFTILMNARNVCPLWWNICKDPVMWRTIDMGMKYIYLLPQRHQNFGFLEKICRYAVDLSCGQLEDISIYNFGTDDLLNYIVDRANHLRSIKVDYCVGVSDKGMCEVAKKLPLVEELHISGSFAEKVLEVLGQFCPHLKSLKYCGNLLSNVGLTAILDGCPLLESLDIRGCPNLIGGNLWERCQNQIRNLLFDVSMDNEYGDYDYVDEYDPTDSGSDSGGYVNTNYGDYLGIL